MGFPCVKLGPALDQLGPPLGRLWTPLRPAEATFGPAGGAGAAHGLDESNLWPAGNTLGPGGTTLGPAEVTLGPQGPSYGQLHPWDTLGLAGPSWPAEAPKTKVFLAAKAPVTQL